MRAAALEFPATLEAVQNSRMQIGGGRLSEAVNALFDRLDGMDWKPVSMGDVWRSARLLVAQHGQPGAVEFAWGRVRELTAGRDRAGVEVWCAVLDALGELGRLPAAGGQ